MKKDYKIEITETLSKTFYVNAKSPEKAEDIIREKYYNEEIVLDSEDFDNNVEFETEEADPRNTSYLMYKGWSNLDAYYISEMFTTLKRLNITYYNDFINDIVNCAKNSELVGRYNENYFNTYVSDMCSYKFSDIEPGNFERKHKYYKTIDNKYIMEFQV